MTRLLCGALLLFVSMAMAQQQERPPYYPPPHSTQPGSPDAQNPGQQMSPGMPARQTLTSAQVAQQIEEKLNTEPILKASQLTVAVDDTAVTLSGTVSNEQEHEIARRIVGSYAGKREIVDHIKIRG